MPRYITKEQRDQLVNALQEIKKQQPKLTHLEIFELGVQRCGITTLPVSSSNAGRYVAIALGTWNVNHRPAKAAEERPPELVIADAEKIIQTQLKLLNQRRDILMQDVKHLDDLIARYKAPRS